MPVDEGRQLFAEPRIRLRSRRDPQYAGRRQRPAMPPLPGRNVGRQRSQELRPLPARLLHFRPELSPDRKDRKRSTSAFRFADSELIRPPDWPVRFVPRDECQTLVCKE